MSRALLITGATGSQGGSVIRALLAKDADFRILAVTRNASSAAAKRLDASSPKVTLIQGNLDDCEAIFETATKAVQAPIWGVFSVQATSMNKSGSIIEETQGKALVDSAIKHGVKHFVYTSVDRHGDRSLDNPTNIPHFKSKYHIEHHLIDSAGDKMSWTILRPATFMDNFEQGFVGKLVSTAWRDIVKSRPLQLIATEDIGVFAALSFLKPDEFAGKSIGLAGDALSYAQLVGIFRDETGRPPPTTFGFVVRIVMYLSTEMRTMFDFFEKEGCDADIAALRGMYPDLKDFRHWLRASSFANKEN